MTDTITYRQLSAPEAPLFGTIDRSEIIDGRYSIVDGKLALRDFNHQVTGWYPSELVEHTNRIQNILAHGGRAFGAWHGSELVGIAALVTTGVGGDPTVMQLEPLHVSAPWRNRGIGKHLVSLVARAARDLGASSLYISATPTRNTVDAYLKMGAQLARPPDPLLFEAEPEDIHLILSI
jgi:GNAT superfamily N-acetyltransferase